MGDKYDVHAEILCTASTWWAIMRWDSFASTTYSSIRNEGPCFARNVYNCRDEWGWHVPETPNLTEIQGLKYSWKVAGNSSITIAQYNQPFPRRRYSLYFYASSACIASEQHCKLMLSIICSTCSISLLLLSMFWADEIDHISYEIFLEMKDGHSLLLCKENHAMDRSIATFWCRNG